MQVKSVREIIGAMEEERQRQRLRMVDLSEETGYNENAWGFVLKSGRIRIEPLMDFLDALGMELKVMEEPIRASDPERMIDIIEAVREVRGMTALALSRKAGMNERSWTHAKCRRSADPETLMACCRALGISAEVKRKA